jgi:hypothetical protein
MKSRFPAMDGSIGIAWIIRGGGLIRSSPDRFSRRAVATGGVISESILSNSNGLRRHFRVAELRYVLHARPESAVDFAPLRFEPRRGGITGESERLPFVARNERFRDAARKPLRSLVVRNGVFPRIVCFQWLDPIFASHESQAPYQPA